MPLLSTLLRTLKPKLSPLWLIAWLGFGSILSLSLFLSNTFSALGFVWAQCALALVASFILSLKLELAKKLLFTILALAALMTTAGWFYGAYSFSEQDTFWASLRSFSLAKQVANRGHQNWQLKEQADLLWTLEAKLTTWLYRLGLGTQPSEL